MTRLLARLHARPLALGALVLAACRADGQMIPTTPVLSNGSIPCSQLHRLVAEWQDTVGLACGPDLSGLLELRALGDGRLLFHRRYGANDDVWTMRPDGSFDPEPLPAFQPIERPQLDVGTAGVVPVPSGGAEKEPRAFVYDPRTSDWRLFTASPGGPSGADQLPNLWGELQRGEWPSDVWEGPVTAPWNHSFLALDEERLLDWNQGTGAFRVWKLTKPDVGEVRLDGPGAVAPGPGPGAFRREHRIVRLDNERLLEWMPRPCPRPRGAAEARCTGADYRIWRYRFDDSSPLSLSFAAEPEPAPGFWPDIGAAHEIAAADAGHLVVWGKDTGELRSFALPGAGDPLGGGVVSSIVDSRLTTLLWRPPTASPELRNLLIVFQEGHSFDSYFGHYCKGSSSANDSPQDCTGPDCCEAMPASVPGAPSCRVLDPETDTYRPEDRPACMRAKMNGGAMDAFASAPPDEAGPCGDARDFACSGGADGADTGAISTYHELARQGALADRFFQTYAFAGATDDGLGYPPTREQNLLYLLATYFTPSLFVSRDARLLTKELARVAVPWAVYTGDETLATFNRYNIPIFYDPSWSPFRSLSRELDEDLAAGILPPVTIVLPDGSDAERSEAPGKPFANGIRFVARLVTAVTTESPQAVDTLVLVAHLTAGGFFDHVAPPAPPPTSVDATGPKLNVAEPIFYGPRVPLLALGPFARQQHVSHDRLEMSSIAKFIEWNWLGGRRLKIDREPDDRSYRDTDPSVANLGDLLDPAATVTEVPRGSP